MFFVTELFLTLLTNFLKMPQFWEIMAYLFWENILNSSYLFVKKTNFFEQVIFHDYLLIFKIGISGVVKNNFPEKNEL